ncbi:MAG: site-specific integrase, partial [Alphaproteobacteria bacterium]|nr:site-specific integrase [Alphaproteobacteria bacterium]
MISSDYFASFEDMLVAERGASRHTLAAYGRDLVDCLDYLRRQDSAGSVVLASANRSQLEAYFSALSRGGFAPQTRARRRVSLRQYFQFLVAEGLREDNPMALIDAPALGRRLPKTLDSATIERLLAQATAEASLCGTELYSARKQEKLAARACRMVLQLELLWGSG